MVPSSVSRIASNAKTNKQKKLTEHSQDIYDIYVNISNTYILPSRGSYIYVQIQCISTISPGYTVKFSITATKQNTQTQQLLHSAASGCCASVSTHKVQIKAVNQRNNQWSHSYVLRQIIIPHWPPYIFVWHSDTGRLTHGLRGDKSL